MLHFQSTIRILICVVFALVLCGCSTNEEPTLVATLPQENAELGAASVEPSEQKTPEQQSTEPTPDEQSEEAAKVEVDATPLANTFVPPFPDRVELFVAPKRQGREAKKTVDGVNDIVELLGFVNVDGQRAVLSIDGLVSPLSEGSIESGVEVISIQPPAVVLQRGRQRWQVNLGF